MICFLTKIYQLQFHSLVPGIPIFGNAIALGLGGSQFLQKCRNKYGTFFRLKIFGQEMVFIFDPASIKYYFTAPESDLQIQKAVEHFTQRIFGLPSGQFFKQHERLLLNLRHLLVPNNLQDLGRKYIEVVEKHIQKRIFKIQQFSKTQDVKSEEKEKQVDVTINSEKSKSFKSNEIDLYKFVQNFMFEIVVESFFGEQFLRMDGTENLRENFETFDQYFEMASSPLPHFLFPSFLKSRKYLLDSFREAHSRGLFDNQLVGKLIQQSEISEQIIPNLLLAVLWASTANIIPSVFWTLLYLINPENQQYLDQVQKEVQRKDFITSALNNQSILNKCVGESIRLMSESIVVRMAARNISIPQTSGEHLYIKSDTIVAICPYISHQDPLLYVDVDPSLYNPERDPIAIDAGAGVQGTAGLAFGGGKYRCPGRSYAFMQISLVALSIFDNFEIKPLRVEDNIGQQSSSKASSCKNIDCSQQNYIPSINQQLLVGFKKPTQNVIVQLQIKQL
eukprot:TRINITY_DN12647_c0_g1_i1.p1 TRINITY_DN12647_c0_g1~~TRINITY_DN12647_c0_g1_i1.p1  ORF type:complete len:506 (+),score=46.06 TRINITY_DN12647_c0_g1_i1:52-1569(+)